jgi:hypothetical protein
MNFANIRCSDRAAIYFRWATIRGNGSTAPCPLENANVSIVRPRLLSSPRFEDLPVQGTGSDFTLNRSSSKAKRTQLSCGVACAGGCWLSALQSMKSHRPLSESASRI